MPEAGSTDGYAEFMHDIGIFLVSFFVIADFWYGLSRMFASCREADHSVIIADFCLLAAMALIPITTKWIISDASPLAVANYGVVYLAVTILRSILFVCIGRKRWKAAGVPFRSIARLLVGYDAALALENIVLMLLAQVVPHIAMQLFLALPISSFFMPSDWLVGRIKRS